MNEDEDEDEDGNHGEGTALCVGCHSFRIIAKFQDNYVENRNRFPCYLPLLKDLLVVVAITPPSERSKPSLVDLLH